MTRLTLPTCRAHYPDGPDGCARRLLPRLHGLPRFCDGSASATSLSRPAQALLTLRPVGSLDRPRRPLSRGFGPAGCPSGPLASYQLNRQLAGWNLPPLVNRALRAHAKDRVFISADRSLGCSTIVGKPCWRPSRRAGLKRPFSRPPSRTPEGDLAQRRGPTRRWRTQARKRSEPMSPRSGLTARLPRRSVSSSGWDSRPTSGGTLGASGVPSG